MIEEEGGWNRRERLRGCGVKEKEKGDHWRRSFMEEEKGKEIQGGKRRRGLSGRDLGSSRGKGKEAL